MNKNKTLLFLLVTLMNTMMSAQTGTSSPYSRFGLGELNTNDCAKYNALGGSAAYYNALSINPYNPATYTAFKPNSFLFSTGGLHKTVKMQTNDKEQITNNSVLSHLVFGFPVSKKIGVSIGMIPYSSAGYMLNYRDEQNNADMIYSGDGGLSKMYFGGAYKITNSLSLGMNASYLFGGLNRQKKAEFDDVSIFNSRSVSRINLKGYYYSVGMIYIKELKENMQFTIGIRANNKANISANRTILTESFEYSSIFEVVKDTAVNSTESGVVIMPQQLAVGGSLDIEKKWLLSANYSTQNWSDYRLFEATDSLQNSMSFSAGVQYTPDYNAVTKLHKRMHYRLGMTYGKTPLHIFGTQLKERSISIGMGIPLKKTRTMYDVSITMGERGTTDNNLIKEQFVLFGLSISYEGIWFVKQKYD